MNRSRYNTRKLALYVARKLAPANHKSKLPLIDIYEQYKKFAQDEGVISLSVGDLSRMITEFYKDVKIDGGVAIGLEYRKAWQDLPKEESKTPALTPAQRNMILRYQSFLYDYPQHGREGCGFTVEKLAAYETMTLCGGQYSPGWAKLDVNFCREFLKHEGNTFERDGLFYYRPS